MWWTGEACEGVPSALLSLNEREVLTPPLRGGTEEGAMAWRCCRREELVTAIVVGWQLKEKIN